MAHFIRGSVLKDYPVNFCLYTANGESHCAVDINDCRNSTGRDTVVNLAENNDQFLRKFVVVYTKMIEKVNYFRGINHFCHELDLVIIAERYCLQVLVVI